MKRGCNMAITNNSAILKSISHDKTFKKFFIKMVSCLCPSSGRLHCSKKKERRKEVDSICQRHLARN